MKRYQECNLLEKIWRNRFMLLVPINTYRMYRKEPSLKLLNNYWDISISESHYLMRYYYTSDEVKKMMEEIKKIASK